MNIKYAKTFVIAWAALVNCWKTIIITCKLCFRAMNIEFYVCIYVFVRNWSQANAILPSWICISNCLYWSTHPFGTILINGALIRIHSHCGKKSTAPLRNYATPQNYTNYRTQRVNYSIKLPSARFAELHSVRHPDMCMHTHRTHL